MYYPSSVLWTEEETLVEHFGSRGISRRQFLEFCGGVAAMLGLESCPATSCPESARLQL